MWCSSCQQDVPGIAPPSDERHVVCARCGTVLGRPGSNASQTDSPQGESPETGDERRETTAAAPVLSLDGPPIEWDDWDDDLHDIDQLVGSLDADVPATPARADAPWQLYDTAHSPLGPWHGRAEPQPRSSGQKGSSKAEVGKRSAHGTLFSWTFLSIGLMAFACGAVLMGWSFFAERGELWQLGTPLALGGQAAILIGLVLQLEGIWQSNRNTEQTLDELDGQLSDLKHATTLLSTTHSSAAQSFYTHMAEGASPQLMLADLKGQLDMLAVKMSQEK